MNITGKIVEEVLGDTFSGLLVSDFYSAYNIYPGHHQCCWVHMLRDLSQLREEHAGMQRLLPGVLGSKISIIMRRSI